MTIDIAALANKGINGLMPYQPGKPVEELERELGISDIVKLASNENPLGLSPKAAAAITKASSELARYPDANGYYLKQKLAKRCNVAVDQISLGNGSNEVIEILFRTFVSNDDEVIFDRHAFIAYALLTQSAGATAVSVPSVDWGHDLDGMLAAITDNTKLICIANPNNPTGTYLQPQRLTAFLAQVPSSVLVVLDEAYFEYVPEAERADGASLLERYPNLVITRTFSKAYGLAGLRVGYMLSSTAIADLLNRVKEPFNCNLLALAAAEAVLDDHDYVQQSVTLNQQQMVKLTAWLDQRGVRYIPSYGNFVTIEVDDAQQVYQQLLHKGVIVRPVGGYGMPNHLRVSIGLASENERFITALDQVLSK